MTYIQAFDKIKEKLSGRAEISQDCENFAVQVTLTNKDSHGIFYLKYFDGFLDIQPYDYVDNDASVSLSYQTFLKLTDGHLSLDDAVSKGLAEIYGSRSVVEALCGIVPAEKKQNAKAEPNKKSVKTTAKETDSKTTEKTSEAKDSVSKKPKKSNTVQKVGKADSKSKK